MVQSSMTRVIVSGIIYISFWKISLVGPPFSPTWFHEILFGNQNRDSQVQLRVVVLGEMGIAYIFT
jgi:hypothetical protein